MLSPDCITPKEKTASIYSCDSGYGSNTLEDEELFQHPAMIGHLPFHYQKETIGLGISDIWNVEPQRLHRMDSPVDPVITRVHVFPARTFSQDYSPVGGPSERSSTCVSCQLWTLTKEGTKCNNCRNQDFIKPDTIHERGRSLSFKHVVPRLEIPQEPQSAVSFGASRIRCSACEIARQTGLLACSRCSPDPDFLSPISPLDSPAIRRSCAKRPSKLPSSAVKHLRNWLQENHHDPYPDAETKCRLALQCGISEKQVNTWFTNTRARKLAMPTDRSYSSSDDEGIYDSGISSRADTPVHSNSGPYAFGSSTKTSMSAMDPPIPDTATLSPQTSRRGKKKDYRRLNNAPPNEESPVPQTSATPSPRQDGSEQTTWQCTFCRQHLVQKSWRRHEETQHRPKRQWTCLATGPRLTTRTGMYTLCAFCSAKNPDENHFLRSHRILECSKKSEAERTFGRPDHLRQHVKNFHKCSLSDHVRDKWRRDEPGKNFNEGWRCGFCGDELKTWDIRETHIANHFKAGATMASWTDYTQINSESSTDNKQSVAVPLVGQSIEHHHPGQQQPEVTPHAPGPFQQLPDMNAYTTTTAGPSSSQLVLDTNFDLYADPFGMDYDFSDLSASNELDMMFPSLVDTMNGSVDDFSQSLDQFTYPDIDKHGNAINRWNGQQM